MLLKPPLAERLPTQCLGVWGIICLTDRSVAMLPSSLYACAIVASVVVVRRAASEMYRDRTATSVWLIGFCGRCGDGDLRSRPADRDLGQGSSSLVCDFSIKVRLFLCTVRLLVYSSCIRASLASGWPAGGFAWGLCNKTKKTSNLFSLTPPRGNLESFIHFAGAARGGLRRPRTFSRISGPSVRRALACPHLWEGRAAFDDDYSLY